MLVKKAPTLSPDEVAALYDRIGTAQDTQVFYERPAVDLLIEHGAFADATTVLEVGCGTGRVAERLLRDAGPLETRYIGVDVSMRMVQIARDRLSAYEGRATVEQTDGTFSFDVPTASQDRVVATYVLDVLAPEAIQQFFGEARRVLQADGRVCLAGLTWGTRPLGRLVSALWAAVHRLRPSWVGGCRPLHMCRALPADEWRVVHHERVQAWGVPSEVLIATPC